MEKKLLKVGDRIYTIRGSRIVEVRSITRVTPKRAFINGFAFEREYSTSNNGLCEYPYNVYNRAGYYLENEHYKALYEKQQVIKEIEDIKHLISYDNLKQFSLNTLQIISAHLQPLKNKPF